METPLEITFTDVSRSEWSEDLIREHAARLESFSDEIIACRVSVSKPHQRQHSGNAYRVQIIVNLPHNRDLVVTEEPSTVERRSDLGPLINSAFKTMERRLKESGERRRRDALAPGAEEHRGLVVKLFEDQGYGFLRTPAGREFYFHRNSVLHQDFGRLSIGTEVRFEPEMGEMGPQASTVQIVNKPGQRESEETRHRDDVPLGWRDEHDDT